jgi:N-acetylmuramoyl-L-alanine amidase
MKIALCAGHHQESKGAVNKKHNLNEFDECTKVLNELAKMLVDDGHEVHAFSGTLTDKIKQINGNGFDLALDLHMNADYDHLDPDDFDNSRGHGCMVMYHPAANHYTDREPDSKRQKQADNMAYGISMYMGTRNLGGRPGWYWGALDNLGHPKSKDAFTRLTDCPAFIPEPGYIDNNGFAEKWLVANRHGQIAEAIAQGIRFVGDL